MSAPTKMLSEALQAPDVVARQISRNANVSEALGAKLRAIDPTFIVTCARGSSDAACTYGKYLIETRLGVPVASMAPSVSSIYRARLKLRGAAFIAVSQSGKSPDILAATEMAKAQGALVIALVNDESAPLAALADWVLPLQAGPELSVAATKSFIASLAALAQLVGAWRQDAESLAALQSTPEKLREAANADWSAALEPLESASSVLTLARGLCFGAAQEAALKLKETCGLHAEAFSAAEVRHGPMAIVRENCPVLAFRSSDAAGASVSETVHGFANSGARLLVAGGGGALPFVNAEPEIEPLLFVQSFYRMANDLALLRGQNPDAPPTLKKETATL